MLEKTNNNEPLIRFNKKCQANIIIKNSIAIGTMVILLLYVKNLNEKLFPTEIRLLSGTIIDKKVL